jgi:hypothetical protein
MTRKGQLPRNVVFGVVSLVVKTPAKSTFFDK